MSTAQPRIGSADSLLLRPWESDDRDFLVRACADPELVRWLPLPSPYEPLDADRFIAKGRDDWRKGRGGSWLILDRTLGPVGSVGARGPHFGRVELGYWLAADARGRGLASAALALLADHYCAAGLRRIELVIPEENLASLRVAERAGFVREGLLRSYRLLRDEPLDCAIYARLCGADR
jgi:ribosomal-protein-alanine N-acetyltransferase